MHFRLVQNLSTLDDLERPKRPARRNKQKFWRPPEKFRVSIFGYAAHCLLSQVTNSPTLIREIVIGKLKDRKLRTCCI